MPGSGRLPARRISGGAGSESAWCGEAPVGVPGAVLPAADVHRMLPGAMLVVDLFHVVQLAVKATEDVRRRAVRDKYGRRGRAGDAEYGVKNLPVRNLEHLSSAQFAKVMDALGRDRHGQQIAAAWIAKEEPRDALNLRTRVTGSTPCEHDVRDRLFAF